MNTHLASFISLYQRTLSPDHGWLRARHPYGFCRFHPTCSEYARQALLAHGTARGLFYASRRIIRCHPWSAGGYDPIPHRGDPHV